MWDLVARRAALTPDDVMIVDEREVPWSFAALAEAAEAAAAALAERGVGAGATVSWQLPTGIDAAVLICALARLGAIQNPLLPPLRATELRPILEEVRPQLLVVPRTWNGHDHAAMAAELATPLDADILVLDLEGADGLRLPQLTEAAKPLPVPPAEDGARWIYTSSGSTARPKAIVHTDSSVLSTSQSQIDLFPLERDDVFPVAFPLSHIGGMIWISTVLRVGCRISLHPRFDPVRTPLDMARVGATILGSATPFFLAYLAAQERHGPEPLFPGLRFAIGGGAAIPPGLHRRVADELGGLGVFNGYGLTECPALGFPSPGDPDGLVDLSAFRVGTDVDVRILDPHGHPVASGQQGELLVRGPQSFLRYLDDEATSAAVDTDGFVRTGDLATRIDANHVRISGRSKDVIIRNGENIAASEIEAILLSLAEIEDVAVVGLPDPASGERVCAVIVPARGAAPPSIDGLVGACRAAGLARFKHVERLAIASRLPRGPMGKLIKPEILNALVSGEYGAITALA